MTSDSFFGVGFLFGARGGGNLNLNLTILFIVIDAMLLIYLLFDTATLFSVYEWLRYASFISPFLLHFLYIRHPIWSSVDFEQYLPIYLPTYLSPSLLSFRLLIPCFCSECILRLN